MVTITMGVVQAKILYFISVFVLPWERERAPCPVCSKKEEHHWREKEKMPSLLFSHLSSKCLPNG